MAFVIHLKKDEKSILIKPLACATISVLIAFLLYKNLLKIIYIDSLCFIISFLTACVGYVLLLFIMKIITPKDIQILPLGNKILKKISDSEESKNDC